MSLQTKFATSLHFRLLAFALL